MRSLLSTILTFSLFLNIFNVGAVFSNSSDHVATVHTTILPPVTPLSLQKSNTTIREGERINGMLSGGVAPYSVKSVKITEKDAQGNEIETTSTDLYAKVDQITGEVTITAKQRPGNYTVQLKDKYDQTIQFGVTVLDALLTLGSPAILTPTKYTLNLTVGDKSTIPLTDYYVGLQSVTQDTYNVTATIVDEPDLEQPQKPRKYLLLDAREPGITKLEILDAENTKVVLEVTVTGAVIDNGPSLPLGEIILSNLDFDSLGDIGLGLLTFQAQGDVQEISIKYIEETGIQTIEILTLEPDGTYSIPLSKYDTTKTYNSFQLSIKDTFGNNTTSAIIPFSTSTQINQYNEGENLEINGISPDTYTRIDNAIIKIEDELKLKKIKSLAQAIIFKINIATIPTTQKSDLLAVLNHINTRLQQQLDSLVLKITKVQYTPTVEDGYIGGFYFKVNAPSLVQDVGIEYYNGTTTQMPGSAVWQAIDIENEGDGEFAAFILPQTKYTFVRGYVVDNNGQKSYTRTYGNLITAGTSIQDYYNLEAGKLIAGNDTFNGEVAVADGGIISVPLLISFGVFAVTFAASVYVDYQCSQQEDIMNFYCLSSYGATVVSIGGMVKTGAKLIVVGFATKLTKEATATTAGVLADDITNMGLKFKSFIASNYKHNLTVLKGPGLGQKLKDGYKITSPQAHHIFPQNMRAEFLDKGINIDDPKYLVWVESKTGYAFNHQSWSSAYNTRILSKFNELKGEIGLNDKSKFLLEIEKYAKLISSDYNYIINY